MSEKRKVLRAAGIVGFFTLISRFTGLIRDMLLAAMFGDGRMADTFYNAFELTNQSRRVLGEGALSSFIVPFLSERRERGGAEGGWVFFNRTANLMLLIAFVITLLGTVFAREVFLIFGGFGMLQRGETEMIEVGAQLTRIMFPIVILLTLTAVMMGACHTLRSFTAPTLGSVMLNLAMIVACAALIHWKQDLKTSAVWLCWSVLAGGVLRILIMLPTLARHGWRWRPELDLSDPDLRRLFAMLGLSLASMGVAEINVIISGYFANLIGAGVKTYLVLANRIVQFPMALTATAVATAMLPQLSQYLIGGRRDELRDMMGFTKRLEIIFMAPATVGLMLLGTPILALVYERGKWGPGATAGAYQALLFYAPGLLALGWVRILQPLYYAQKDLKTPLLAAAISVAVNVLLNCVFVFYTHLDQGGLALANSLAAFANYGVLAWALNRRMGKGGAFDHSARIAETLWKSLLAAVISCAGGMWLHEGMSGRLGAPTTGVGRAALLLPIITLVAAAYFALLHLFRTPESREATGFIVRRLRRGRRSQIIS